MLIGFIFGAGLGAWVYSKVYRSTGGNTTNALIVAGIAGLFAAVLFTILYNTFVPN